MQPGSIVRFRNRDWVLLSRLEEAIFLRPLTGVSDEAAAVHRRLVDLLQYRFSTEGIQPSQFPAPSPEQVKDAQSLHLFWQAARLLLREGAAPLRSLGRISVRPRTYQLVPLMMAFRLDPVRILIADDVGVGKTIEAGLIVRELWERGQVRRLAVLCPPYLCDQWQKELIEKFHLEAVVISSANIGHLERRTPPGCTVYQYYPVQVISIDFVKHARNKHAFLLHAPELIIVDEAHGATPGRGQDRQLRYELVRELAQQSQRHLILLTATPHSGIPEAFQKLLGLLDPEFEQWDLAQMRQPERIRLARHFVQRTRKDIEKQWEGGPCFPNRETLDAAYTLSSAYRRLFEAVYDFCTEIVESGRRLQDHRRRMRWWSALALLRCVMSSPRAAKAALQRRRKGDGLFPEEDLEDISPVYEPDDRLPSDELPTPLLDQAEADLSDPEKRRLRKLERMADAISEADDHKLSQCIPIVRRLLQEGFQPVIWCYYVDTAEYVAQKLQQQLEAEMPHVRVLCITGRLGEEERRMKVEAFRKESARRVLVATDCLSEGINLQDGFNAVLHYDLPWNPNRLEQREGRVDRYGQSRPVVKAIRYYGKDNPVDGAVIRVLLNKARQIYQMLGTHVPTPQEERFLVEALVHALFFSRRPTDRQLPLHFGEDPATELHHRWELDARREKESRTRFAQHALKPEEVRRELEAADQVLGDPKAVQNFVLTACQKLGIPVRPKRGSEDVWEVATEEAALLKAPEAVRRAMPIDRKPRWTITFTSPTPQGAEYLGRNHPFVTALARYLFEQAFSGSQEAVTARCGAIRTKAVVRLTRLMLLRPRFLIQQQDPLHKQELPPLLAEEVLVTGWEFHPDRWLAPPEALALLGAEPAANLSPAEKQHLVGEALKEAEKLLDPGCKSGPVWDLLQRRAAELQEAHRRLRQAVGQSAREVQVEPHWPPDLLGILVLQPVVGATP